MDSKNQEAPPSPYIPQLNFGIRSHTLQILDHRARLGRLNQKKPDKRNHRTTFYTPLLLTLFVFAFPALALAQPQPHYPGFAAYEYHDSSNFSIASYHPQIKSIETYLHSFSTLHAQFIQSAPGNHSLQQGKIALSRPGKLRIEYQNPKSLLILMNKNKVVYHDRDLDQVTHTTLDFNPFGLLIYKNQPLLENSALTIIDIIEEEYKISLVVEPKDKNANEATGLRALTFEFNKAPMKLARIHRRLETDEIITMELINPTFDNPLDDTLFMFKPTQPAYPERALK